MNTFNQIILYFFSPNPGRAFEYYYAIGALILVFFLLTFGIYFYATKHKEDKAFKKLFRNYPTKFVILAVLLAMYLFIRYNNVPFFSMRFMMYILLISSAYVIYAVIMTFYKKYPEEKNRREKRLEQNKYIPKKKKK